MLAGHGVGPGLGDWDRTTYGGGAWCRLNRAKRLLGGAVNCRLSVGYPCAGVSQVAGDLSARVGYGGVAWLSLACPNR